MMSIPLSQEEYDDIPDYWYGSFYDSNLFLLDKMGNLYSLRWDPETKAWKGLVNEWLPVLLAPQLVAYWVYNNVAEVVF